MYQIYVDRFCNGDPSNDVLTNEYQYIGNKSRHIEDWYQYPAANWMFGIFTEEICRAFWIRWTICRIWAWKSSTSTLFLFPRPTTSMIPRITITWIRTTGRSSGTAEGCWRTAENENTRAERYIRRVTDLENLEASDRMLMEVIQEGPPTGDAGDFGRRF